MALNSRSPRRGESGAAQAVRPGRPPCADTDMNPVLPETEQRTGAQSSSTAMPRHMEAWNTSIQKAPRHRGVESHRVCVSISVIFVEGAAAPRDQSARRRHANMGFARSVDCP